MHTRANWHILFSATFRLFTSSLKREWHRAWHFTLVTETTLLFFMNTFSALTRVSRCHELSFEIRMYNHDLLFLIQLNRSLYSNVPLLCVPLLFLTFSFSQHLKVVNYSKFLVEKISIIKLNIYFVHRWITMMRVGLRFFINLFLIYVNVDLFNM